MNVTYAEIVMHIGLPLILFMLALLIKQNRDARIAMANNIERVTKSIRNVEKELTNYQTTWMTRKESLLNTFRKQCEQTQGACRALVEIQLETLRAAHDKILEDIGCNKDFCEKHWTKQDEFNAKVLSHLADTKLHNRQ